MTILEDNVNPQLNYQGFHILKEYEKELVVKQFNDNITDYSIYSTLMNNKGNEFIVITKNNNNYRLYFHTYSGKQTQYKCNYVIQIKNENKLHFVFNIDNILIVIYSKYNQIYISLYTELNGTYILSKLDVINTNKIISNLNIHNDNSVIIIQSKYSDTISVVSDIYMLTIGELNTINIQKKDTFVTETYELLAYYSNKCVFNDASNNRLLFYNFSGNFVKLTDISNNATINCIIVDNIILVYENQEFIHYYKYLYINDGSIIFTNIYKFENVLSGNMIVSTSTNYIYIIGDDSLCLEIYNIEKKTKYIKVLYNLEHEKCVLNRNCDRLLVVSKSMIKVFILPLSNNNQYTDYNYDNESDYLDNIIVSDNIIKKSQYSQVKIIKNNIHTEIRLKGECNMKDLLNELII